ncbi:MAG: DUF4843 domain-containing protein [Dysgonamonadaceae bacterium]|jgi:hypothetical protein|nr:DUF4843 domain-containing protein [Dysgonamonadaceae bacterium]
MKKKYSFWFATFRLSLIGLLLASCTEETPLLYQNDPAIYFGGDSLSVSFTEIDGDAYIFQVPVVTQGDTSGVARQVVLSQDTLYALPAGYDRAQLDVNYELDHPSAVYAIPAGKAGVNLAVKVFRTPDFLEGKSYVLDLRLLPTADFRLGMKNKQHFRLKFSGLPVKPSNWDSFWGINIFGSSWGPVKHDFIITACGKIDWKVPVDVALGFYYQFKAKQALAEYNTAHPDAPLSERDGTRVSFEN